MIYSAAQQDPFSMETEYFSMFVRAGRRRSEILVSVSLPSGQNISQSDILIREVVKVVKVVQLCVDNTGNALSFSI